MKTILFEKELPEEIEMLDPAKAFQDAIDEGRLSKDPEANNYAGEYMYMLTKNGKHYFKNSLTRQYLD